MFKIIVRFIQPAGFALLLLYLIFTQQPFAETLFWIGLLFSLLGAFFEISLYLKTPNKKRSQGLFLFGFGVVVKLLLITGLALRVYEVQFSVYFLLGSIILAFIWGILSVIIKPNNDGNDDILDVN